MGDKCAGGGGTESMLDIEYINAMGEMIKNIVVDVVIQ